MEYRIIKTTVNVKTHTVRQTIETFNSEKELEEHWEKNSNILCAATSGLIRGIPYWMQSEKVKDSDCIVSIIQYSIP